MRSLSALPNAIVLKPFRSAALSVKVGWSLVNHASGSVLDFQFTVNGPLQDLVWPTLGAVSRGVELWKSTCCEIFIHSRRAAPSYIEWNVSPSGEWDVHQFARYRQKVRDSETGACPNPSDIDSGLDKTEAFARFSIPVDDLVTLLGAPPWQWQPTAVLVTKSSGATYWAKSHPAAQPDFHLSEHLEDWDPLTSCEIG